MFGKLQAMQLNALFFELKNSMKKLMSHFDTRMVSLSIAWLLLIISRYTERYGDVTLWICYFYLYIGSLRKYYEYTILTRLQNGDTVRHSTTWSCYVDSVLKNEEVEKAREEILKEELIDDARTTVVNVRVTGFYFTKPRVFTYGIKVNKWDATAESQEQNGETTSSQNTSLKEWEKDLETTQKP